MHLNLTKSRDNKLLQDLLDKKLRVIVIFEDDYLNHIARIAYKDIQQDNYTYRIGEYSIYKGEEWGFCDFCKRHDCYFIVPNDTPEGSERPEPYNPVYDEAYLNEKIKKATESWKGVDVDAMLAECRGYDEEKSEKPIIPDGLDEEVHRFFDECIEVHEVPLYGKVKENVITADCYEITARHFAEWQKEQDDKMLEANWGEGFRRGKVVQKEQMLKGAVEGLFQNTPFPTICLDDCKDYNFKDGDKVRVIVLPKEVEQ